MVISRTKKKFRYRYDPEEIGIKVSLGEAVIIWAALKKYENGTSLNSMLHEVLFEETSTKE